MTVALTIALMAAIGRLPVIYGFASCVPPVTLTPILTEYGWKKTLPAVIALAILTFLLLPGSLAAVIALTSYYVLLPDICCIEKWKDRWIMFCIPSAVVSSLVLFVIAGSRGFAAKAVLGNVVYLVLLAMLFIVAAMYGKLHIILRERLYMPLLHPIVKKYL